jgi:hypothetical protein
MRSAARPAINGLEGSRKRKHIDTYNGIDEWSDEEEADEWDSEKNETEDERMPDADDEEEDAMSEADEESEDDDEPRHLVVRLKVSPKVLSRLQTPGIVTQIEPGASTPEPPTDGATTAGALKCEPPNAASSADKVEPETQQVQQPWSSPTGPSAYPTPTSSSFLPPEQKQAVAPLPRNPYQSLSVPSTNVVTPLFATKEDDAGAAVSEAKPAHPIPNGVHAGDSGGVADVQSAGFRSY